MALQFKFPDGADTDPFVKGEYWSEEFTSLTFNMWFCGVGHIKAQADLDKFYRRYIQLNLSQGGGEPFLSRKFVYSIPIGFWTNGGTLTDAAFNKKLIQNINSWADRIIELENKEDATNG